MGHFKCTYRLLPCCALCTLFIVDYLPRTRACSKNCQPGSSLIPLLKTWDRCCTRSGTSELKLIDYARHKPPSQPAAFSPQFRRAVIIFSSYPLPKLHRRPRGKPVSWGRKVRRRISDHPYRGAVRPFGSAMVMVATDSDFP